MIVLWYASKQHGALPYMPSAYFFTRILTIVAKLLATALQRKYVQCLWFLRQVLQNMHGTKGISHCGWDDVQKFLNKSCVSQALLWFVYLCNKHLAYVSMC